jgi:hypothetical protein
VFVNLRGSDHFKQGVVVAREGKDPFNVLFWKIAVIDTLTLDKPCIFHNTLNSIPTPLPQLVSIL